MLEYGPYPDEISFNAAMKACGSQVLNLMPCLEEFEHFSKNAPISVKPHMFRRCSVIFSSIWRMSWLVQFPQNFAVPFFALHQQHSLLYSAFRGASKTHFAMDIWRKLERQSCIRNLKQAGLAGSKKETEGMFSVFVSEKLDSAKKTVIVQLQLCHHFFIVISGWAATIPTSFHSVHSWLPVNSDGHSSREVLISSPSLLWQERFVHAEKWIDDEPRILNAASSDASLKFSWYLLDLCSIYLRAGFYYTHSTFNMNALRQHD